MVLKRIYRILEFTVLFALLFANYKYYHSYNSDSNKSVIQQLNYLNNQLHKGADLKMQGIFPEGYVYMNALYGLTWCEIALQNQQNIIQNKLAVKEALFALNNLQSDRAQRNFSKELKPQFGIFYQGWVNYLRGKILLLEANGASDTSVKNNFLFACSSINSILSNSKTPFLESYPGASWPADMMPAIISLSIHDKLFPPKYQATSNWFINEIKKRIVINTELIPHRVDSNTGSTIENARGSSEGISLRLLAEIDTSLALELYKNYKIQFAGHVIGLAIIREFQSSSKGSGDIDSGPVIFGAGSAATIVGIAASRALGDNQAANELSAAVETIGISFSYGNQKSILFGRMPIADAFIAWSNSTPSYINPNSSLPTIRNNRGNNFHLISAFILFLIFLPEIFIRYKNPQ